MVIRPFGQSALLVEVATLNEVVSVHRRLTASAPEGITDLVPAARTVLVAFDPARLSAAQVRAFIEGVTDAPEPSDAAVGIYELDIVYDGEDLRGAADLLGVSPEALVAAHRDTEWTVAFTGFAPGFGYLTSPEWPFTVPRLVSPRTRVPAGAVGLAGEFTGAYPRETPGGWQLIGTTSAPLFTPDADPPALLTPGSRVRFVESPPRFVPPPARSTTAEEAPESPPSAERGIGATPALGEAGAHSTSGALGAAGALSDAPGAAPGIRIVEPGLLATVQDLGRPGRASLGIALSGALDRRALRTANRLLGNGEDAAAIEVTMGGFRAVAERDLWFVVAGAWGPIRLDGRAVDPYQPHPWRAGTELHLDWFGHGARGYLAVQGGIDAPLSIGSRATDTLAGLGPHVLRAGDALVVGTAHGDMPELAYSPWGTPEDALLDIGLAPGPRADWFAPAASVLLFEAMWAVSNHADRVGIRLDGPELPRVRAGELPSEAMVPGALQVPPEGRPVILGADGPVTGGYPVIAVVADADRDLLGQARPGTRIRFRHARGAR